MLADIKAGALRPPPVGDAAALAVPPPFPGGNLSGVVKLDGLDDCRHIISLALRGKAAVVVGGGITALELAEGLNARGMKVHYFFLRGNRYWADVLDEAESNIVMECMRHEGITMHLQTQIKQCLAQVASLPRSKPRPANTSPVASSRSPSACVRARTWPSRPAW